MELVEDKNVINYTYFYISRMFLFLSLRLFDKLLSNNARCILKFMQDVEEIMTLAPEKVLLKWMNFHLKKAGYKKVVTNFSSDLKVVYPAG